MRIEGTVVHGRRLGHALGFPTANLRSERIEDEGPDGVYAAMVCGADATVGRRLKRRWAN